MIPRLLYVFMLNSLLTITNTTHAPYANDVSHSPPTALASILRLLRLLHRHHLANRLGHFVAPKRRSGHRALLHCTSLGPTMCRAGAAWIVDLGEAQHPAATASLTCRRCGQRDKARRTRSSITISERSRERRNAAPCCDSSPHLPVLRLAGGAHGAMEGIGDGFCFMLGLSRTFYFYFYFCFYCAFLPLGRTLGSKD